MNHLHLAIAYLHIRSFYLYCKLENRSMLGLAQLYGTAISLLETVALQDKVQDIGHYCPDYVFQAIMLSASIILKLLRSPVAENLDIQSGTSCFFTAINICKKMYTEQNDVPSKAATIMSQLWLSDMVHKNADGTYRWPLRVRCRLAAGAIYDAFLWWRDIFRVSDTLADAAAAATAGAVKGTEIPLCFLMTFGLRS